MMGGYRLNPLLRHGFQHEQDFNFEIKDGDGNVIDIVASFDKVREDLSKKVNKEQGAENRNKVLVTDNNGKVALSSNLLMTSAERSKLAKITEDKFITTEERDKLARISNVLIFKNVLPRESDLTNISQKTVGDVYYVTNSEADGSISYKQYVWTGDRWAVLGTSQNIKVTELQAADHIRIQDDTVSAHSFVPQYDSVSKVLPGENQFQYTGPTTPDGKWVQDFFYRKKEISKPIYNPQNYHFGVGTEYIDVLQDGFQFPRGRYYDIGEFPASEGEAGSSLWTLTPGVNNGNDIHYRSADAGILRVGDKVWTYGDYSANTKFWTITEVIRSNLGYVRQLRLSNGELITLSKGDSTVAFRRLLVSENGDKMYWVDGTNTFYFHGDLTNGAIGAPRPNTEPDAIRPSLYHDGLGWVPGSAIKGELAEAVDVTVNYVTFAGVYDWVQTNVQPTSPPFDSTDIENRLDSLQAEKATLSELAEVARTGDYNSLLNRPNVKVSEGTKEFWNTNKTYVPISGEIVIVSDFSELNGINIPNLKIGDGSAFVADLPYLIDNSEIAEHLKNQNIHISQQDRDNWNSKVSASISEETLILN